nr:MAG TPA: hypothetical protein [Caudoviricetes sp.]DAR69999.1 MAG TPA: hypothetical protein [Caudoviricetes sp.]
MFVNQKKIIYVAKKLLIYLVVRNFFVTFASSLRQRVL